MTVSHLGKQNDDGVEVVAPTFLFTSEQARLKGFLLTAAPGIVTVLDVAVTGQLLVQGGQFWIKSAADGDSADFSVVDKDNVLGLHTQLGLPLGTPIELVKYVDGYQVPGGDMWRDEIIMPTVAPVTQGLYLRATYHSVGATDVKMGILYRWYEG